MDNKQSKNIGFRRNIRLAWLDAAAACCAETRDLGQVRCILDEIVGQEIASAENRRMALDILVNIWVKSEHIAPALWQEAIERFPATPVSERLWLHYGLTLVAYPFFRDTAAGIGQLTRFGGSVSPVPVKQRLVAERGQLGSLDKAVERVIYSLRDWGVLTITNRKFTYQPQPTPLSATSQCLEGWLLACALRAHPAHELPAEDLLRLPELFPFAFTVTVNDLHRTPHFEVQRQGAGWDTVQFRHP